MSQSVKIQGRSATIRDSAQLAAMNQQLIRDEGHRNPMSLRQLQDRMSEWLHQEYTATLFLLQDETVGYALYRSEPDWIYLRHFFVLPAFRRQGVGRAAIDWLIAGPLRSARRIRLDVLVGNTGGIGFWRSMGFQDYCITLERSIASTDPGVAPT